MYGNNYAGPVAARRLVPAGRGSILRAKVDIEPAELIPLVLPARTLSQGPERRVLDSLEKVYFEIVASDVVPLISQIGLVVFAIFRCFSNFANCRYFFLVIAFQPQLIPRKFSYFSFFHFSQNPFLI